MRQGTAAAIKILEEIAFDLGMAMMLWDGTATRSEVARLIRAAKVEFSVRARKLNIPYDTLSEITGWHRMTIMAYRDPALKARRNARHRIAQRRRNAARKTIRTGIWEVPVFHRSVEGLYTAGQLVAVIGPSTGFSTELGETG